MDLIFSLLSHSDAFTLAANGTTEDHSGLPLGNVEVVKFY